MLNLLQRREHDLSPLSLPLEVSGSAGAGLVERATSHVPRQWSGQRFFITCYVTRNKESLVWGKD